MFGILLVIDGPDASGKGTQHALLMEHFRAEGVDFVPFDFPQYGKPSAWYVERYLNGDFGEASDVGPKQASEFYAMDRFAAKQEMNTALADGKVLLMNRYVLSNMAHQGGKIEDPSERRAFYAWLDELEHGIFGIPRPNLNVVLLVDVEELQARVDTKGERAYLGGKTRDIHEDSIDHLRAASRIYADIVNEMAENVAKNGQEASVYVVVPAHGTPQDVHERIWEAIAPYISDFKPSTEQDNR